MDSKLNPDKSSSSAQTVVLVLGMHRSGTSAVTRIVSQLGASLPDNLIPASVNNEAGFWESLDLVQLDDALLEAGGTHWDDWRQWEPARIPADSLAKLQQRMRQWLDEQFARAGCLVLKDPRLCRLLMLWKPELEGRGITVKCVLPLRHPLEVAASLEKRDGIDVVTSGAIWLRHMLEAEANSRDWGRVFVRYERMLEQPEQDLARIADLMDVPLDASAIDAVTQTLSGGLRHHSFDDAALDQNPMISTWVRSVWSAFQSLDADVDADSALAELDRVRAELNHADEALGPLLAGAEQATKALRASEQQVRRLDEKRAEQAAELGRRRGDIEALTGKIAEIERELGHRRHKIETLTRKAEAQEEQLQLRQSQVEELHAELHTLRSNNEALTHAVEAIRTDLRGQNRRLDEARASLKVQRAQNLAWLARQARWAKTFKDIDLPLPPRKLHGAVLGLKRRWQMRKQAQQLLVEGGFDIAWYRAAYPDTDFQGAHPIWHWILCGWRQGWRPAPLFDAHWYVRRYPDVAEAEIDPLFHYLTMGKAERREPGPLHNRWEAWFALQAYIRDNPDVTEAGVDPLHHFLLCGGLEGRAAGPYFDCARYLGRYPDVAAAGINPLIHYLLIGEREARLAPPVEDESPLPPFRETTAGVVGPESEEAATLWLREEHVAEARSLLGDSPQGHFSIVMPTWNRRGIIQRAIDSVVRQSWRQWELIICDDGSTDQTADWVREHYAGLIDQGQIKYLDLPHRGVSAARNAGLSAAAHDWIAYLDSDNAWDPNYLLVTAAHTLARDDVRSAYSCLHVHDAASNRDFIRCREFDLGALRQRNYIDLNVFSHHRELYERLGGFDENLRRLVDWDLILRYSVAARPRFIPLVMTDYYTDPALGNITLTVPLDPADQAIRQKSH